MPGVDIESPRALPDADSVGRRILSEEESRSLGADHVMEPDHLLRVWTRKEAVINAVGRGLAIDPASVTLPVGPGDLLDRRTCPCRSTGTADVWLMDLPASRPRGTLSLGGPRSEAEQVSSPA